MSLTLIQVHVLATASGDNVASVDIPEDGFIVGIDWDMHSTGDATGYADSDHIAAQLSFIATNQFLTNDARGVISNCSIATGTLTTSGIGSPFQSKMVAFPEPLDVAGGERVHLHIQEGGVATATVNVMIHLKVRGASPRRSRRRR